MCDPPKCYKSYVFQRETEQPELGHTPVDCVGRYTVLVECVLAWQAVGRGAIWPASSSLRGPSPPRFNPLRRGWAYRLAPEATLFRGIPVGPEAFLEPPGACRLRSCARTHLKIDLCYTCMLGGAYDKYQQIPTEQLLISSLEDMYPTASQQPPPNSLDHRTTVSNYDSQFGWESSTHAVVRTRYYGRALTHGLSYPLLLFSSDEKYC